VVQLVTPIAYAGDADAARSAAGVPVLDGLVTSRTRSTRYPSMRVADVLRSVNRERRFRRMRRVVIAAADASREACSRGGFRYWTVFVTLTYAATEGERAWSTRDVSQYVACVREWLRRRGVKLRYQWALELQGSGRPHYHLIFWLPDGMKIPKPDSSGHWSKGFSWVIKATRPVGYLVKYVSKSTGINEHGEEMSLPRNARLFGTGSPDSDVKHATHRAGLPMWLDARAAPGERCSRVLRQGWTEQSSGVVHPSPYVVQWSRDEWGQVVITVTDRGV
jgi:hypothetical protein